MNEEPNFNFDLVKIKAAIESGLVSFPRGLTPEQRKEWIRKPHYLQQEVLDKAIEDGERKLMERVYQDKYEKLTVLVNSLFKAIAHGDEEHREWLETAIKDHFSGKEVQKPYGKGSKELLKELTLKYKTLLSLVEQNNQECDWECNARARYCIDYLAVGRRCSDCPKQWKIDIEENK